MKLKFLFVCILFVYLPQHILSQIPQSNVSLDEIAQSLETNLTYRLENELYSFFTQDKIAIKANIRLYRSTPQPAVQQLPDLPNITEFQSLPGLPILPPKKSAQQNSVNISKYLDEYLKSSGYRISQLIVNAIVDSSLTREEKNFIRRFITLRAGLRTSRGDRVHIEVLKFPQKNSNKKSTSEISAIPPVKNTESLLGSRYLLFFILLLTMAIIILSVLIYKSSKRANNAVRQTLDSVQPAIPLTQPKKNVVAPKSKKPSVTEYLIGAPAASAHVFKEWINTQDKKGYEKTSILLKQVSPDLIDLYKPYLGETAAKKIRFLMNKLSPQVPDNVVTEILNSFDHDFRILALKETKNDNQDDLFAFIHQLTDDQILHLMQRIQPGLSAIIIAQLQPDRGARLLKRVEPEKQKNIFSALSKIDKIPLKIYKQIAQKLAQKAQRVSNMKFVTADNIETTVNLLDQFDESTQQDLLNHLKCNDIKFADQVESKFMKFSDVISLPGNDLREIFRTADREVIAASIVDLSDDHINRIIATLPEKMAELVRSSLKMKKFAPESEIDEAKRKLVRNARNRLTKIHKNSKSQHNVTGVPRILMED